MPYLAFFITGDIQADFLRRKLEHVLADFKKEFNKFPAIESIFYASPKDIVNNQILPYYINKAEIE
ncbi:MAG: hypothetical protein JXA54_05590 [Candidatus Heimdallarchaeota archaeon]|nr:hypothetical protein [Candidatus Heimdallarchaeota archaeon]